ncbi:MAG: hypothetical protein HC905_19660, partial [Bacteroidales bacterium]|nr:hypothetical protein [Bacteroidales bacterium]
MNNQLKEFSKAAQILPFEKNLYWFVFENKIALFEIGIDFKTKKILELNQRNIHSPGNDLEIIKIDSKNIIFPNHRGFIVFDAYHPGNLNMNTHIRINKLNFQGKGKTREVCGDEAKISIPYYLNNLTVYFSDPSRFNMEE